MATKTTDRLTVELLETVTLKAGGHERRSPDTVCVMEAIAWMAGREHTDHPSDVSAVIGEFLRTWNDAMDDADRQQLKALVPLAIGTAASPEVELRRSYMALDWYCRVSTPAWLRAAGLVAEAEAVEALAPIVDGATASAAEAPLTRARQAAYAAGSAAEREAWSAAEGAAEDAAWSAAWSALRPTVAALQASAMALVERMVAVGRE